MHDDFREAGWKVFGIYPIVDGSCGCGQESCKAPGKHPIMANWQHVPQWSDEQWEVMHETGQLASGYGVLLTGLLVVDVDVRNGGNEGYERLVERIPAIAGSGLVVKTGSNDGSKHLYFSIDSGIPLVTKHPDYPGIDFKSGASFVIGPGSLHLSGHRYETLTGSPYDIGPAPQELVDLLRKPDRYRAAVDGSFMDVSESDLQDILDHYPNNDLDYDDWVRVGMALHHATRGAAIELWDEWSKRSSKYTDFDYLQYKWHSFGKSSNPVTLGTLIHHAKANGWSRPVTFECLEEFEEPASDGLPFSIAGVDLLKPPGFVGEIADWIEDQSRRPRRTLAVAGALTAIGNIAGLRYTDDLDGVTTNLFAFCVAGSRTGKESIQQAVAEVHRAAGIGLATHGAIKSEQEIVRNLIRHQAAYYIIDEIGIFLRKVKNAQERGGASYLEAVIGMLMAAYSKADSSMLLTGDTRDEVQQLLIKELAQVNKQLDEGKPVEHKLKRVQDALDRLDKGIDRPFLSLIGFTTPITFEDLADFQSATNGFIGRALIFNERETVPRSKKGFKKRPMDDKMMYAIRQIYSPGEYDSTFDRVEYYGDRKEIPTDGKAADMLSSIVDWLEDQAEAHKEVTGLESLYLGAYELVSKVSLILACPEGRRTSEHVRWAFALVRNDLDAKARLVTANDREIDAPDMAIRARIANIIDGDGEKVGVIYNRMRNVDRETIDRALAFMVEKGVVLKEAKTHPVNKRVFEIFRMNSEQ